jgi:hypothetical protein
VQSFAEGLAVELRPRGVSVLSVAPGPVSIGFGTRARMRIGKAELPENVARIALQALQAGGTVRPGAVSKVLGWSLALLPRWGRGLVLGQIMKTISPARKPDHETKLWVCLPTCQNEVTFGQWPTTDPAACCDAASPDTATQDHVLPTSEASSSRLARETRRNLL